MNKGMVIIGIIVMFLLGLSAVFLVTSQQSGAELDYYLVKETAEAAMSDAIDSDYYADYGVFRMDKEKFMEYFLKRFADHVDSNREYKIDVYDINETPPKVSVRVSSIVSGLNKTTGDVDVTTDVDMILQSNNTKDKFITNRTETINSADKVKSKSNNEKK